MPLIRRGLSETNWQDIPDDQKALLKRRECDRRVFDDFDRYLKDKRFKFRVFVAQTRDKEPVGYVSVGETMNPDVGLKMGAVLDFWVAADHRDKGIGTKLLDYALECLASRGYSHAGILVSASNGRALTMYKKKGFKEDRIYLARKLS
jgi:ribosomal protein S18 acetylase RimI-like enzyme